MDGSQIKKRNCQVFVLELCTQLVKLKKFNDNGNVKTTLIKTLEYAQYLRWANIIIKLHSVNVPMPIFFMFKNSV